MELITAIEIRQMNKERIRRALQQQEKCIKADIAKTTKLSMATCSTALNEMLKSGEILKVDQTGFSIGRPADVFTYNPDYLHALALCTTIRKGQNFVEYVIADALGHIIYREKEPIENVTMELLDALITSVRIQDPQIQAVGLGIPGQVRDGFIEQCDISSLQQVDFAKVIHEKHGIQVIVENDMNVITYSLYGKISNHNGDFATLFFPDQPNSYVGSGYIVNGHLLKGSTMLAGELRHAANAFGISLDQQQAILSDRPAFLRFVAQMVVLISCTINPPCLVIMGNNLSQDELKTIRNQCLQFMQESDLPILDINNQTFEEYAEGLLRLTLDCSLFPMLM